MYYLLRQKQDSWIDLIVFLFIPDLDFKSVLRNKEIQTFLLLVSDQEHGTTLTTGIQGPRSNVIKIIFGILIWLVWFFYELLICCQLVLESISYLLAHHTDHQVLPDLGIVFICCAIFLYSSTHLENLLLNTCNHTCTLSLGQI